jgi:hypothetical protein
VKRVHPQRNIFTVADSYRNLSFSASFKRDLVADSWSWKGSIDFDSGMVFFSGRRHVKTEQQAKEQMLQFAYGCIDNRLGAR